MIDVRKGFCLHPGAGPRQPIPLLLVALFAASPATLIAGAGDAASTYGLGPANVGSAQAFSPFGSGAWATYYNPAALARSPEGELTAVVQYGDQELRARSLGGDAPLVRENDVLSDQSSELVLLGIKTRIAGASDDAIPAYLGINVGVDEFTSNALPFSANTSEEGQFLRYQSQPLFLAIGGAVGNLLHGIDVGISARLTLAANARLEAVSDLAGNTDSEQLSLQAEPSLTPSLGANIRLNDVLCGSRSCLPFKLKPELALFWRGQSSYEVDVDANVVIPGVIPEPGLDLALATLDTFQPRVYGVGVLLPINKLELVATLERQQWSDLEKEFAGDTVRDQAGLKFSDITVTRLGASYQWSDALALYTGIAMEDSPLKSRQSQDVNFLDSDRLVIGIGADYRITSAPVIGKPVVLSLAYQYQQLDDAEFDLTSINSPTDPAPFETVRADGDVHVISGSLSLRF
jgi:hypothetical protein